MGLALLTLKEATPRFAVSVIAIQLLWSRDTFPQLRAAIQSLFISPEAAEFSRHEGILYGFVVGVAAFVIRDRSGFADTVVRAAGGLDTAIPYAFSTFIGNIIGMPIAEIIGEEN